MRKSGVHDGSCCACGYNGDEETPCPKREDGSHCEHWWDGPVDEDRARDRAALQSADKKAGAP